mgnify:CR=1 FL=1
MARGKLKHPITPASLTSQGVTRKEYCAFLDLVEHHKARAMINRAPAGQPARGIQPPLGARPNLTAGAGLE